MSAYRDLGAVAVQPTFDVPFCGGVCGAAFYGLGFFLAHDLYPTLGWVAVLLSIVSSTLGIWNFLSRRKGRKE